MDDFDGLWYDCENSSTPTAEEQCACERECSKYLFSFTKSEHGNIKQLQESGFLNPDKEVQLLRRLHAQYLRNGLVFLSSGFVSLDSSRPWLCYWIIHALNLLNEDIAVSPARVIDTLNKMQHSAGGFSGGPQQLAHAAPNYAAFLTLCTLGSLDALKIINRENMYQFFLSLKHKSGGFRMHYDGEVDTRGTYTVLAVAKIMNILTPQLIEGVPEYLQSCQTYEGGYGGEPGNEAHGGYNFCALASLLILGKQNMCNLDAQENWLLHRQMRLEGGFQGRTNKLVDSCYSFWQGGALAIVKIIQAGGDDLYDMNMYMSSRGSSHTSATTVTATAAGASTTAATATVSPLADSLLDDMSLIDTTTHRVSVVSDTNGELLCNQKALQRYILQCGQYDGGGMRDKPGKPRDFYHSCYALSGLSVAQWSNTNYPHNFSSPLVYGDVSNAVKPTSAVYNIGFDKLQFAVKYFQSLDPIQQ